MAHKLSFRVAFLAVVGMLALDGLALAQTDDRGNSWNEEAGAKGKKGGKETKAKKQKHENGKDLIGDKIKKNGRHALEKNGKDTAFVDVKDGKIAGVTVSHSEKGNVPVTKYKSTKKMVEAPTIGAPDSLVPVQIESIGIMWIGYAYIDDYGYEVIYWFPYDMILDGDTGAVEFIPIE